MKNHWIEKRKPKIKILYFEVAETLKKWDTLKEAYEELYVTLIKIHNPQPLDGKTFHAEFTVSTDIYEFFADGFSHYDSGFRRTEDGITYQNGRVVWKFVKDDSFPSAMIVARNILTYES